MSTPGLFLVGIGSNLFNSGPLLGILFGAGYRPPQWMGPQLVSVTVTLPGPTIITQETTGTTATDDQGNPIAGGTTSSTVSRQTQGAGTLETYYFDGVKITDHHQELTTTDQPVQNGAALSDHAYLRQARVYMEAMFSDAMDSYITGQYSGNASKSVSAYQWFLYLQLLKIPILLQTRLKTYANMLIEDISAPDTYETLHSVHFRITFKQSIFGNVMATPVSSRADATDSNPSGATTSQPVPPSISQNNFNSTTDEWNSDPGLVAA